MACTERKISRLGFCENEVLCDHNVCVSVQLLLLLSSSFFDSTDRYQLDERSDKLHKNQWLHKGDSLCASTILKPAVWIYSLRYWRHSTKETEEGCSQGRSISRSWYLVRHQRISPWATEDKTSVVPLPKEPIFSPVLASLCSSRQRYNVILRAMSN